MALSTLAIAAILATVSLSQVPEPIAPIGCGDLKITCADRDRSCCEGACCQLLERFQFMATPSPLVIATDAPAVIDAQTTAPLTNCPLIGDECTSASPRGSECCSGSSCRFLDTDLQGHLIGRCCIAKGDLGCSTNADCCRSDNVCSFAGRCQRSLGESQRAVSASASAVSAAASQSAGTRSANRLSIEGLSGSESEPKMGTARWRRLQLFIMALSVVTGCWFLICCNRLVLRRPTEKELSALEAEAEASDSMADFGCAQKDMDSVATVSLSETEDDFDDGTDHEESDEALI